MASVSTADLDGGNPVDLGSPPPRRRRRRVVAVVVLIAVVVSAVGVAAYRSATAQGSSSWALVWNDEFDGPALDPARWSVEDTSTFGEGNLELACLMDRPQNVAVQGGELALTARRESPLLRCGTEDARFPGGRAFSSGFVSTEGHASWRFARVEVRAALPTAPGTSKGLWPALWMRPDDRGPGEIDVLEALGTGKDLTEAGRVHQTLHYDYSGTHPKSTAVPTLPAGFDPTQFHVYALQTEPGRIQWLVDGAVTMTLDRDTTPWIDEVLDSPYFLRMNLAVGGRWPGRPEPTTDLPAALRVDWVRVYQPS